MIIDVDGQKTMDENNDAVIMLRGRHLSGQEHPGTSLITRLRQGPPCPRASLIRQPWTAGNPFLICFSAFL